MYFRVCNKMLSTSNDFSVIVSFPFPRLLQIVISRESSFCRDQKSQNLSSSFDPSRPAVLPDSGFKIAGKESPGSEGKGVNEGMV